MDSPPPPRLPRGSFRVPLSRVLKDVLSNMENLELVHIKKDEFPREYDEVLMVKMHDKYMHVVYETCAQSVDMKLNSAELTVTFKTPFDACEYQVLNNRKMVAFGKHDTITAYAFEPPAPPVKRTLPPFVQFKIAPCDKLIAIVYPNLQVELMCILGGTEFELSFIGRCDLLATVEDSTVGWGSTDTQFKGPTTTKEEEGFTEDKLYEPAVDPFAPEDVPTIEWSYNSSKFFVNVRVPGQNHRRWYVLGELCNVIYHSDMGPKNMRGILPQMAARPKSGTVAIAVQAGNEDYVGMFEFRGTLIQAMKLELHVPIRRMLFSPNGRMLIIWQFDPKSSKNIHHVSLFMPGNGTWLKKQEIDFPFTLVEIDFVESDEDRFVIRLIDMLNRHFMFTYTRELVRGTGPGLPVAIIDGPHVYISHFQKDTLPSPEYAVAVKADAACSLVRFNRRKPIMVVLTCTGSVWTFNYITGTNIYNEMKVAPLPCITCFFKESDCVYFRRFHYEENSISAVCVCYGTTECISCDTAPDNRHHGLSTNSADYYELTTEVENPLELCHLHAAIRNPTGLYTFTVDFYGHMYINGRRMDWGVHSFMLSRNGMLIVTTDLHVHVVHAISDELRKVVESGNLMQVWHRTIEHGAKVVQFNEITGEVTLVMPRGNLETIRANFSALGALDGMIQAGAWHDAWRMTRVDRLNVNLLVDFNFRRFMDNLRPFLDILDPEDVSQFLMELSDDDALTPEIRCQYQLNPHNERPVNKRILIANRILTLVIDGAITELNASRRGEPVVAVVINEHGLAEAAPPDLAGTVFLEQVPVIVLAQLFSRSDPLDIAGALEQFRTFLYCPLSTELIDLLEEGAEEAAEARGVAREVARQAGRRWDSDDEADANAFEVVNDEMSERAACAAAMLRTMSMIVPREKWFHRAIATQDMRFARFVAERSRIDPMIYRAVVERFEGISNPNHLRFEVEDFTDNKFAAVTALVDIVCSAELDGKDYEGIYNTEFLYTYVRENNVTAAAYKQLLYYPQSILHNVIGRMRAEELARDGYLSLAGVVYVKIGDYNQAWEHYKSAGMYLDAMDALLAVAGGQPPFSKIVELCNELIRVGRPQDVRAVADMYSNDPELSLPVIMECGLYSEAIRICVETNRQDLIDTLIAPHARNALENMRLRMRDNRVAFVSMLDRLLYIRRLRHCALVGNRPAPDPFDYPNNAFSGGDGGEATTSEAMDAFYTDTGSEFAGSSIVTLTRFGFRRIVREGTASTSGSIAQTERSGVSARSRRRQARKKYDMREGAPFEDVNIMRDMYRRIEQVYEMVEMLDSIYRISLLYLPQISELASVVMDDMSNVQALFRDRTPEVWLPRLNDHCAPGCIEDVSVAAARYNINELELVYRQTPPCVNKTRPCRKIF